MEVQAVHSLDAALEFLADHGDGCQVLAGGTDVMIQLGRGQISPSVLLHIERVTELTQHTINGGATLGALVTHRELAKGGLGSRFRSVAEAAATVGGLQTQSIGTIGGNVCNASPAADTLPALLVHDAELTLRSASGVRQVGLQQFLTGRRTTQRQADELLTEIRMPIPQGRTGDVYLKVGRRSAMEVAIVGLAMRLDFDADGAVTQAAVALASVGPRPLRATGAEQALIGSRLEHEALVAAGAAALGEISPMDDIRATAGYRRRLIPGLLSRAAQTCRQRAAADFPDGER